MREKSEAALRSVDQPMFVPAVIEPVVSPVTSPPQQPRRRSRRSSRAAVELEINGVTVKITQGTDADTISAVIAALRATR
jgi:transposase